MSSSSRDDRAHGSCKNGDTYRQSALRNMPWPNLRVVREARKNMHLDKSSYTLGRAQRDPARGALYEMRLALDLESDGSNPLVMRCFVCFFDLQSPRDRSRRFAPR